jgi:cytochrome c553
MLAGSFSAIFGAGVGFVLAVLPAHAADDIESKVQACAACHGENGVPTDPKTIPIIWGQQQSYLMKQLHDYRSGVRDNPIMTPIAKGLAQEDLRKIAAFPQHSLGVESRDLGRNITLDHLADLCQMLLKIDVAFFCNKRGIGRHAVDQAELVCLFYLV